ncbi:DUF3021 domain-containing protein [Pseudogracilibacillus auburnensis]|uniref:DUF3021 family protein n=1 Tax=Pseudogracilibacillus auburnensis TaxID=1494959 RepID=A0A2V3VLB6_9BACI|nr:DUF3021 domain-containing protein [Pseudogracilibacillus auburnensis]PXW82340.1 hypothetical protein DFR56_11927 [Pseudogracilibacillus auburnensis]
MIIEVLKRLMSGVAWGGIFTFLALTVLMLYDMNPDVSIIWLYMLASMILGMYFGLASFILEREDWSPLKKIVIHFLLSSTVYFAIAIPIGWVMFTPIAIVLTFILFIIVYILFWSGFQAYYKKVEASLNNTLKKKK